MEQSRFNAEKVLSGNKKTSLGVMICMNKIYFMQTVLLTNKETILEFYNLSK